MGKMIFGTVGSPISTPVKPGGSVSAIIQIHDLGLSALELAWVHSVSIGEQKCREIKDTALEQNVKLSVHAPYYINVNGDTDQWPKSRKRLMDSAYFGFLAGATDIVFHPGTYFNNPPQDVLKIVIPRLQECVAELKSRKIDVVLRPELMGKSAMLGSLEDVLFMSQNIPSIAPCMDFAHLHARSGDGHPNSFDEWCEILKHYENALGKESLQCLHAHLSGIEYTTKGERNHLLVKESDLDFKALLKALQKFDCSGRIMCESPVLEEDALFLQEMWNKG
jgi:deoxyribonuclease IV